MADITYKGVTQITNANSGIKTEVGKSLDKINQIAVIEAKEVKRLK